MQNSTNTGNAGEHLVATHLLANNFSVFIADRNNRSFDLAVFNNGKTSLLRVKTSKTGSAQWTAKKDGTIFQEIQQKNDYCVIILNFSTDITSSVFYIVPTKKVNETLLDCDEKWHEGKKRDNTLRKRGTQRVIWFNGSETIPWRGYNKKWKKYKGNWDQLKGLPKYG